VPHETYAEPFASTAIAVWVIFSYHRLALRRAL
jgi:hypothetical protein